MIFATALVVLGLTESADALVPQQLARALVAVKHASAQTSVSSRAFEACSSHSDCSDDNYCDTAQQCFPCSACASFACACGVRLPQTNHHRLLRTTATRGRTLIP